MLLNLSLKLSVMGSTEIKQELHDLIDHANNDTLELFYDAIKEFMNSSENNKMIAATEIDIKLNNLHSQSEVRKIIESWKE